jgi:hypothetical protein
MKKKKNSKLNRIPPAIAIALLLTAAHPALALEQAVEATAATVESVLYPTPADYSQLTVDQFKTCSGSISWFFPPVAPVDPKRIDPTCEIHSSAYQLNTTPTAIEPQVVGLQ